MKKTAVVIVSLASIAAFALFANGATVIPKTVSKIKTHDGVITQINLSDGSFTVRLRDGKTVTVQSPVQAGAFVSIKGMLDTFGSAIGNVSNLMVKDMGGSDAIPIVNTINPGIGQVGTKIVITGTGFTKKKNTVWIGDIHDAIIGIPSKDGVTLTFALPAAPCNQRTKTNCATTVLPPAVYNIVVANENGVSNATPFQVTPLPQLTITTDILPQITAGNRYNVSIAGFGGAEAYIWRVSDGRLPQGLVLAQGACKEVPCKTPAIISGMPTAPGTSTFTVTLVSGQENISRQFTITVVQPLNNPY